MLPGKTYTSQEVWLMIRRRWWLVATPLLIGLIVGVVVYKVIPVVYKSETLITVVPQRVPDSYVRSTVTARIEDRIPAISDQILSRSRLERIITEFDLFKEQRQRMPLEDVVQLVRANVHVDPVGKESFKVSFTSADPNTAQKVAERLASLVIQENLRDREKYADSTNQFLESQLEEAKRRLEEHEKKLEAYRNRNQGTLPSELQSNLQAIQNAQLQLTQVSQSINHDRERRLLLERQIGDAQSPDPVAPIAAGPNGQSPDDPQLTAAQRLEVAKANLEIAKRKYTAEHPDVKALERQIVELTARAEQEAKMPQPARATSPTEVARQRRLRDLQGDMEILDRQIAASVAEEGRLKRSIGEYQSKIDIVPTRETELVSLTRDYDTLQETYKGLLEKQEESKLAANLERRQIGEQLRIVDPASLPERPSNQSTRLASLGGSALGGLLLGLLMIGFIEYRDSSFKSEEDVTRVLALPVLATIPVMDAKTRPGRPGGRTAAMIVTTLATAGGVAALLLRGLQS